MENSTEDNEANEDKDAELSFVPFVCFCGVAPAITPRILRAPRESP